MKILGAKGNPASPSNPQCLIVAAHAVHPAPNNAEGIVNAAWLDALRATCEIELVTSPYGYQPLATPGANWHQVRVYVGSEEARRTVDVVAAWTRFPKWHPLGLLARLADRASRALSLMPLSTSAWATRASRHVQSLQRNRPQPLPVWARGTPPESFQAAILAYWRRPFPLAVNYNDPMPHCLLWGERIGHVTPAMDRLQHRQNRFHAAFAQAFTFPSRRLAELMAEAGGFDSRRCFVIPHLTPSAQPGDQPRLGPGNWMLYAGSFYPAVFPDAVREGLARFARQRRGLRIVMALKKPSSEDLAWIAEQLPETTVFTNLDPHEMARLKEQVHAILVADAPRHAPLLLTKVAEAARTCLPIFAITSSESTTADIVRKAGGGMVAPANPGAIADALVSFEAEVLNRGRLAASEPARRQVAARFSEERIVADSLAVLDYACHRFAWQQAGAAGAEPEAPPIEMWP